MDSELFYTLALKKVKNIGSIKGIGLIKKFGNSQSAFEFLSSNGLANDKSKILIEVERELKILKDKRIEAIVYGTKNYPNNLSNCRDAPLILYKRGDIDINNKPIVSIVGTRLPSEYGYKACSNIIKELSKIDVIIVSGFAKGIDIHSHMEAIRNNLKTLVILGHGFSTIFPASHRGFISKIVENGAFLTEFEYSTGVAKENFPKRNRIIAGISDATIVIQSDIKGGSMITARIANSYNREVFALPGKIDDPLSKGCNHLIRNNLAQIISDHDQIIDEMNWGTREKQNKQSNIFEDYANLSKEEILILKLFNGKNYLNLENIIILSKLDTNTIMKVILEMELKGIIKSLPGKFFEKTI